MTLDRQMPPPRSALRHTGLIVRSARAHRLDSLRSVAIHRNGFQSQFPSFDSSLLVHEFGDRFHLRIVVAEFAETRRNDIVDDLDRPAAAEFLLLHQRQVRFDAGCNSFPNRKASYELTVGSSPISYLGASMDREDGHAESNVTIFRSSMWAVLRFGTDSKEHMRHLQR